MKKLHVFAFCLALILLIPICYYTVCYASGKFFPAPPPNTEEVPFYAAAFVALAYGVAAFFTEILAVLAFIFAIFCMFLLYPVIQAASNKVMKIASISLFAVSVAVCITLLICYMI